MGTNNNNEKKNKSNIVLLTTISIIILAIATFLIYNYNQKNKKEDFAYTQLLTQINDGTIEKIELTEGSDIAKIKIINEEKEKNVLIVDDLVMSGDFLHTIKQRLCTSGFNKKNIRFISIVTTDVAISTKKSPDYYWKKITADECYFPWGKAK